MHSSEKPFVRPLIAVGFAALSMTAGSSARAQDFQLERRSLVPQIACTDDGRVVINGGTHNTARMISMLRMYALDVVTEPQLRASFSFCALPDYLAMREDLRQHPEPGRLNGAMHAFLDTMITGLEQNHRPRGPVL
jgi:hypothetical protein